VTLNRCEEEVDAIRDKIMEETKHLTREENNKRLNEQAQRLAAQYGFKIDKPSSKQICDFVSLFLLTNTVHGL